MSTRPKRSEDLGFELDLDGKSVPISVVRRTNARRYILRVRASARDIQLTMPPYGSLREARLFAEGQSDWIAMRLECLPKPLRFVTGTVIPYKGRLHVIEHRPDRRSGVWIEPGAANPRAPERDLPRLCVACQPAHMRRRVREWLRQEALRAFTLASRKHAKALGVEFNRVMIRDQKSRWGSCSISGTLAYSWRLILAPTYVLDYLAAHEVAHLKEMNHSDRFWKAVYRLCPATDRAEAWLKVHGRELHRYDAD